jgi:phosphoglycerate dehydrogenase-like enzyme
MKGPRSRGDWLVVRQEDGTVEKLLIASGDGDLYREIIAAAAPELEIHVLKQDDPAGRAFAREMDVLFAWKFPPELLQGADRLRWIQSTGAGVDHIMAARPLPPRVTVTRMVDVFGLAMAEYVLGYLFAVSLGVRQALDRQRDRHWEPYSARLLRGRVAVVVGLGSIGREVCRTLRAAGVRAIGVSRRGADVPEADEVLTVDRLDEALPVADFLVLAAPLTEESRGLIDGRRLGLLPRSAWLVNVARGGLVRESALIDALRAGQLGGAVLDVFEREPLPPESLLWKLDNVYVTPHVAGPDDVPVNAGYFLENYRRFKAGQPLAGVVDLDRGY